MAECGQRSDHTVPSWDVSGVPVSPAVRTQSKGGRPPGGGSLTLTSGVKCTKLLRRAECPGWGRLTECLHFSALDGSKDNLGNPEAQDKSFSGRDLPTRRGRVVVHAR